MKTKIPLNNEENEFADKISKKLKFNKKMDSDKIILKVIENIYGHIIDAEDYFYLIENSPLKRENK